MIDAQSRLFAEAYANVPVPKPKAEPAIELKEEKSIQAKDDNAEQSAPVGETKKKSLWSRFIAFIFRKGKDKKEEVRKE